MGLLDWLFPKKIDYQQVIESERDYTNKKLQEFHNELVLLDCKCDAERLFEKWKISYEIFGKNHIFLLDFNHSLNIVYDEEACWYNKNGSILKKKKDIFNKLKQDYLSNRNE